MYGIFKDTGDNIELPKIGISGQDLTKKGTSSRATRQVNKWNREEGGGYFADVLEENIPGRAAVLEQEKMFVEHLKDADNHMPRHILP